MVHTEQDSFDYNKHKENVHDEDLIPVEDLVTDKRKLRYSEHFANLYGSLRSFVSGFIPEYNIFKQTKDVDETDNKEFYDLNEPMIDIDQDNIEYQEKFGNGDKENSRHPEQDSSKNPDRENLKHFRLAQDKNRPVYTKDNNYNKDSENFEENKNNDELGDNFEEENQIYSDEKEKRGNYGSYFYDLLHGWFNQA